MAPFLSAGYPVTPSKRDDSVERIIRQLNNDYGLDIEVPDSSLTPSRRKQLSAEDEQYAQWDRICRCIRFLYYQRDDTLDRAIEAFANEAKAASLKWVPKPRADPGTLPSPRNVSKPRTPGQQWALQTLLVHVLEEYMALKKPALLIPRPNLGVAGPPMSPAGDSDLSPILASPESAGSKRSFDSDDDQLFKRRKGRRSSISPSPSVSTTSFVSAFDNIPSRQRPGVGHPLTKESSPERPWNGSGSTARVWNSPRGGLSREHRLSDLGSDRISLKSFASTRISSLFSQRDGPEQTQTTLEASSQERERTSAFTFQGDVRESTPQEQFKEYGDPRPRGITRTVVGRRAGAVETASGPTSSLKLASRPLPDAVEPAVPPSLTTVERPQAPQDIAPDLYSPSPSISAATSYFSDQLEDFVNAIETLDPSAPNSQTELRQRPGDGGNAGLQARLENIWREWIHQDKTKIMCAVIAENCTAKFPRWLHDAPLAIAWEVTRICLHCRVDIDDETLSYDPAWTTSDIAAIWRGLGRLDIFRGKSFPERPAAEVFSAALTSFKSGQNIVVMSAALEFNPEKTGPLFLVDMKPLRFDEGCRLTRRFGPDRFFEILVPSPTAMNAPPIVREHGNAQQVIRWLTERPHSLVGREWRAFYAKDVGYRKPAKELRLGPEAKATFKERVHFFAENGHNFRPLPTKKKLQPVPADDDLHQRTEFTVSQMLDWLLQLKDNEDQPHLKLFSRIQLGLSKTLPAVTLEPGQIRHRPVDILSPTGKVMNDGIGLMSRSLARKVRNELGLSDIPSAIQGRMGSAKGMWLIDVTDSGDDDWIETYPSQRKWKCDFADPCQRTLEVRSVPSEVKSAGLNLQFLPVLEAQAEDPQLMRQAIGARLQRDLEKQFESQKAAFRLPLLFRQWVTENSNSRSDRVRHGHVPFLGGLPENKGEIFHFLLNSGFDPKKQKYVQDLAWELQMQRCDLLKTKLNIKVERSAYLYMVVDFWGVLEENEVHVGFSTKFRDDSNGESYTLLSDCDVLVARSPAHFVSDMQKVKAVFKSELHALKDVIVFSRKGNIPLADKLSGGDYDGDLAWVCWDKEIVDSFTNAEVPNEPDLSAYLGKDKTTFAELVQATGKTGTRARYEAVYDMISKSFQFAMQQNFLGICTNYKEKLCYHNNSVSDGDAVILSTLVGKLVDQSKQGILFDKTRWERLQKDLLGGRPYLNDPAYKGDIWTGKEEPRHIIDYLKFVIAKPAVDRELEAFHLAMQPNGNRISGSQSQDKGAEYWDPDLTVYYEAFNSLASDSRSYRAILDSLTNAIGNIEIEWSRSMSSKTKNYPETVKQLYAKWCAIEPRAVSNTGSNRVDPKTAAFLEQPYLANRDGTGYWALLKASTAFKIYHRKRPKFVWQMAGRQLAFIKAQMASGEQAPILVTPLMYAGLSPDGKFVKQFMARMDGEGSEYLDPEGAVEMGEGEGFGEEGLGERAFRGDDVD